MGWRYGYRISGDSISSVRIQEQVQNMLTVILVLSMSTERIR